MLGTCSIWQREQLLQPRISGEYGSWYSAACGFRVPAIVLKEAQHFLGSRDGAADVALVLIYPCDNRSS